MKKSMLSLLALTMTVSLWAAEFKDLPLEMYDEIVVNSGTLGQSGKVFQKLLATSTQAKQYLEKQLPQLVTQLSNKYEVDKELVSLYFGIEQAKKLNPALFKNTEKLSMLLEEIAAIEKDPTVLKKMVAALTKAGAHFTHYRTRLINGDHALMGAEAIYRANSDDDLDNPTTIAGYSNSQFFDFVRNLGPTVNLVDVNMFKANDGLIFRFLIEYRTASQFKKYLIVDTNENFNVLSSRHLSLPQSIDNQKVLVGLVTSHDGAHSSIIFRDTETIYIVSLEGQIGTITAEIKQDKNNYKISKIPWQK